MMSNRVYPLHMSSWHSHAHSSTHRMRLSPGTLRDPIIGASLSEPHTSVTALRTRVYLCAYACLDRPLTGNFKWAHSNISRRSISRYRKSMWRPVEGYCQSAASWTRSEDDWSWSTRGTGLCFYRRRQAAHRRCKFNMDGCWLLRNQRCKAYSMHVKPR